MNKIIIASLLFSFVSFIYGQEKTITQYNSKRVSLEFLQDHQVKYWIDENIYIQNGKSVRMNELDQTQNYCFIETRDFDKEEEELTIIDKGLYYFFMYYQASNTADIDHFFLVKLNHDRVDMFACDFLGTRDRLTIKEINRVLRPLAEIVVK